MNTNDYGQETSDKFKRALKKMAVFAKIAFAKLMKLIIVLIPKALLIILIGAIGMGFLVTTWRAIIERRGAEQKYTYYDQNALERDDQGKYFKATSLGALNSQYEAFYKYIAKNAYYQLIGNSKVLQRDENIKDYYNREELFTISTGIMFSLDEHMHKKSFRYPEQFAKPVYCDLNKMKLLDLTDEDGLVIAKSKALEKEKRGKEEGMRTKKEVNSVRDYGIGSIFKYFKDDVVFKKKGKIVQRQIYDEASQSVVTINTDIDYEEVVGKEEGYFMKNAITFVGDWEFLYERQEQILRPLDESETKVQYDEHIVYEESIDPSTGEMTSTVKEVIPLYQTIEGDMYHELPVVVKEESNYKGLSYIEDYLQNYETDVPESVMEELDFEARAGKFVSYGIGTGMKDINYDVSRYDEWFEKYGEMYGVDPRLLASIAMTESSGDPFAICKNSWGLMQIDLGHKGNNDPEMVITEDPVTDDRFNPEKSIKWAAKNMAYLIDYQDGDVVKALYSYNYGIAGFDRKYKKMYAKYGEDWLSHMDNDYAAKVFSYYDGDIDFTDTVFIQENDKGFLQRIKEFFKGVFDLEEPREKRILYKRHVNFRETDVVLRVGDTFDNRLSFLDTELTEMSFWDRGFRDFYENSDGDIPLDVIQKMIDGEDYFLPVPPDKVRITSKFGDNRDGGKRKHKGIDIGVGVGTKLYATDDGVVQFVGWKGGYGKTLIISHQNGINTLYGHLNAYPPHIKQGARVQKGDLVAYSGNTGVGTGPHLHFEYRVNGTPINPEFIFNPEIVNKYKGMMNAK